MVTGSCLGSLEVIFELVDELVCRVMCVNVVGVASTAELVCVESFGMGGLVVDEEVVDTAANELELDEAE